MPMNDDYKRRLARDGAAMGGDSFDSNSAGNVAVAQSLDMSAVPYDPNGPDSIEPFQRLPISKPEIEKAYQTLLTYKQGKANLERRLVENQQWYKLRQWEVMRRSAREKGKFEQVEPVSAWLLNSIANKHASAMDNFPSANVLPREEGDKQEAKMLSSIIPVVLKQCGFEGTYSEIQDDKLESGTGVYGIFWDPSKINGLGDIDITCVDLINLFWESGITDIQQSRNVFYVTLQDNDILEQDYPELQNKLSNPTIDLNQYIYDDTIDTNGKSAVVDWYYKKRGADGKTILHYCKFVAGQPEPLFATENDPEYADRGWYDHGLYPFVFDRLMRCKGTPTGFGFIDIGKSAQEYIDRLDQALLQNALFNARPRHFIRNEGGVNEAEFADVTKDFIHVDGNLGQDSILPVQSNPLNSLFEQILVNKIQELKETTGNRDVTTGGTTGGVTAASAIAAMQEAGGRLDRDNNKGSYRAFLDVILICIELIRQFYDIPRYFRILGQNGAEEFVQYSNAGLLPQPQGQMIDGVPMEMGVEVGYRLPLFDIDVTAEKQSPYSRMAQNELALQFYGAGFFAPNNADSALACLEMMDFDHKDFVVRRIEQNGTLFQMLQQTQAMCLQLAQQMDAMTGGQMAPQMAQQFAMAGQTMAGGPAPEADVADTMEALGGEAAQESPVTRKARMQAAETTAPR
jgi:hypothetical protein